MSRIVYPETLSQSYILYLKSFVRNMQARNLSEKTIESRLESLCYFGEFLQSKGMPQEIEHITREHIETYIQHQLSVRSANTAMTRYRALNVFFNWLVDEGELKLSPMSKMHPPKVIDNAPDVLTKEQLQAILKTCSGKSFEDRRDSALILLLIDTGLRRAEVINILMDQLDLDLNVVHIAKTKGGGSRVAVFGKKTSLALDQYIRIRRQHKDHDLPYLWLGLKGKLTVEGIYKIVLRRCKEAGIEHAYVHLFRHSFANMWLEAGGSEGDLMRLGGWKSPQIMRRYGSSAADQRARDSHRNLSPGDRI